MPGLGLGIGGSGDIGVRTAAVRVNDVVIANVHSESFARWAVAADDSGDRLLMCLVRRGAWRFARPDGEGMVTVAAGSFLARREGPPSLVEVDPGTAAMVLVLPASAVGPLAAGGQVTGSTGQGPCGHDDQLVHVGVA